MTKTRDRYPDGGRPDVFGGESFTEVQDRLRKLIQTQAVAEVIEPPEPPNVSQGLKFLRHKKAEW